MSSLSFPILAYISLEERSDPIVEVAIDVFFDCNYCGDCCKKHRIPVSEKDISLLQMHNIPIDSTLESLSPILFKGKPKEQVFDSSNPFSDNLVKAYILRKKPYIHECIFLQSEQNIAKCSVHSFKPLTCRIYPFSVKRLSPTKIVISENTSTVCDQVIYPDNKNYTTGNMKDIAYSIYNELLLDLENDNLISPH